MSVPRLSNSKDVQGIDLVEMSPKDDIPTSTNRLALAQDMTVEEFQAAEKSLKRKLDTRLLLTMWVIFIMNYLDRVREYHLYPTNDH